MQEEPSTEQLLLDVQRLSAEVENLKRQKADLEILPKTQNSLKTNLSHFSSVAQNSAVLPKRSGTNSSIM